MSSRVWALLPWAIAMNVLAGWLVGLIKLPLYLDSVGTVLAAALGGPLAGILAGLISNTVLALVGNPMFLPFGIVAAVVGCLAGFLAGRGFFANPWTAAVGGLFTGVAAACVSAPISAYVFGGVTGGGTDLLVAYFRSTGRSALEASLSQGLVVDPVDKLVSFVLIQLLLASLPTRLLQSFRDLKVTRSSARLPRQSAGPGSHRERRSIGTATTLYLAGDGLLHRRAPLTKLLLVLVAVLWAWTLPTLTPALSPALPLLAFGLLGLSLVAGVGLETARAVAVMWGPVALSVTLVNHFFGPGALTGVVTALRLLILLEAALLLVLTTRPDHLAGALERLGLSPKVAYVLLSALSLLPLAARRLQEIRDAQVSRGLDASRLSALLPLLGPVLMSALAEVEQRALALEARGFGAHRRRTYLEDPPGSGDLPLQLLLLAAALAVFW